MSDCQYFFILNIPRLELPYQIHSQKIFKPACNLAIAFPRTIIVAYKNVTNANIIQIYGNRNSWKLNFNYESQIYARYLVNQIWIFPIWLTSPNNQCQSYESELVWFFWAIEKSRDSVLFICYDFFFCLK